MGALIQNPLSYRLLELFGTQKAPGDFVDELNTTVQPVLDVSSMFYAGNLQYSNGSIIPATGHNILFNNPTGRYIRICGASLRSGSALGAGVSMDGFLTIIDTQVAIGPCEQLSDRLAYATGTIPMWNARSALRNIPIIMAPTDQIAFWNTTLGGAAPTCTFAASWIELKS